MHLVPRAHEVRDPVDGDRAAQVGDEAQVHIRWCRRPPGLRSLLAARAASAGRPTTPPGMIHGGLGRGLTPSECRTHSTRYRAATCGGSASPVAADATDIASRSTREVS